MGLVHNFCGAGAAVGPPEGWGQQAVVADPTSVISSITLDLWESHPGKNLEALRRNDEVKGTQILDLN